MARRPKEGVSVSLFPFLSILCCVIGVLTLLIAVVSLTQIDANSDEQIERALEYQELNKSNQQDRARIAEFRDSTTEAKNIRALLEDARDELRQLQKEQDELQEKRDEEQKLSLVLLADSQRAKKRQEELDPELTDLKKALAELQKELALKKEPREANVVIRPSGSGQGQVPVFVECAANDIVINYRDEQFRVRRGDLGKSETFQKVLKAVKETPKASIIFLIRNDGVGTYNVAWNVAREAYVSNGKLAVLGQGNIDVSLFKTGS